MKGYVQSVCKDLHGFLIILLQKSWTQGYQVH
jgi:hypothetical protein